MQLLFKLWPTCLKISSLLSSTNSLKKTFFAPSYTLPPEELKRCFSENNSLSLLQSLSERVFWFCFHFPHPGAYFSPAETTLIRLPLAGTKM